jgi:glyoxalase superfamily protein
MAARMQLVIDCADPTRLARFWMLALHYVEKPVPEGYGTWNDYWREVGVPEDELDDRIDLIVDPDGAGPTIWFQQVPEAKTIKNRLHLDIGVSGRRNVAPEVRREQIDTEVARLVAAGATVYHVHDTPELDHYGVTMRDPEGNEFCVN